MNHLSPDEKNQLQQRLSKAIEIGQLLKLKSLADWQELVSRYSQETGEPILAKFHTDENHSVTGIYYLKSPYFEKYGFQSLNFRAIN